MSRVPNSWRRLRDPNIHIHLPVDLFELLSRRSPRQRCPAVHTTTEAMIWNETIFELLQDIFQEGSWLRCADRPNLVPSHCLSFFRRFENSYRRIVKCANECARVLTSAHVCSRVLTFLISHNMNVDVGYAVILNNSFRVLCASRYVTYSYK